MPYNKPHPPDPSDIPEPKRDTTNNPQKIPPRIDNFHHRTVRTTTINLPRKASPYDIYQLNIPKPYKRKQLTKTIITQHNDRPQKINQIQARNHPKNTSVKVAVVLSSGNKITRRTTDHLHMNNYYPIQHIHNPLSHS